MLYGLLRTLLRYWISDINRAMKRSYKTFKDQDVQLDDTIFEYCKFDNCKLIYSGMGKVSFNGCSFNNPHFTFTGPAANAIDFLTALYAAGGFGRETVENTFKNIRGAAAKKPRGGKRNGD